MNTNRRNFERFALSKPVNLICRDHVYPARLADISLRGLLLTTFDDHFLEHGQRVEVTILLDDEANCCINLLGAIAHVHGRRVGIHVLQMDLSSSSNLRRLIEVNLGDIRLLERELEAMIQDAATNR